jgi:predicted nucleic acid-binding protein
MLGSSCRHCFSSQLQSIPTFEFVALDESLAQRAVEIAADYRLRGGDAVYVAIAQQDGTTLVTFDNEQRTRIASVISALTPSEAIAELEAAQ